MLALLLLTANRIEASTKAGHSWKQKSMFQFKNFISVKFRLYFNLYTRCLMQVSLRLSRC